LFPLVGLVHLAGYGAVLAEPAKSNRYNAIQQFSCGRRERFATSASNPPELPKAEYLLRSRKLVFSFAQPSARWNYILPPGGVPDVRAAARGGLHDSNLFFSRLLGINVPGFWDKLSVW
jgi:hypothetical protein